MQLDNVKKGVLGYGIKNTFRNTQPFVEEVCENGYRYTKFGENMQSFLSKEEARDALRTIRDRRYELDDFSIVSLWPYLQEEDIVKAYLTCLQNDAFQIDTERGNRMLSFKNGDNALSISFIEYDSDKDDDCTSRESAGENGCILMEDGFVYIYVNDPYQGLGICRLDNIEGFDELEKEVVKLVKTKFNVN